jgi:hypothetical protein
MRYKIGNMLSKFVLITIISLAFFADKCGEKAGEGELAKRGYATAQPVIEALEKYRQDNKTYPDSWIKLVPKYIKELPKDGNDLRFSYGFNEAKSVYILEFTYDGSGVMGITECSYYSDKKSWTCSDKS